MRSYRYLLLCAKKSLLGRGFACPSCGGRGGEVLDRKYVVTSFRRCQDCCLLFRTPTTSEEENARFYQSDYEESTTTECPANGRLAELKAENFASLSMSYLRHIKVIQALGAKPGQHVMDFGCSWGYGSYQLQQAGFTVEAFEISNPRCQYAREKLGIATVEFRDIRPNAYDVFFSAHVIEHVPSVSKMLALGERSLKPGGLFVAFTPNGSLAYRRRNPKAWHLSWGGVHPQLIDDEFVRRAGKGRAFVAASAEYPIETLRGWNGREACYAMDGWELMLAFRKADEASQRKGPIASERC